MKILPLQLCILIAICFLIQACDTKQKRPQQKDTNTVLSEKSCIKRAIAVDDSLGTIRNHACESISLTCLSVKRETKNKNRKSGY